MAKPKLAAMNTPKAATPFQPMKRRTSVGGTETPFQPMKRRTSVGGAETPFQPAARRLSMKTEKKSSIPGDTSKNFTSVAQRKHEQQKTEMAKNKAFANDINSKFLGVILMLMLLVLSFLALRNVFADDPTQQQFEDWFRRKGGWMLPQLRMTSFAYFGKGIIVGGSSSSSTSNQQRSTIHPLEKVLEVPKALCFSKYATLQKLSKPNRQLAMKAIETHIKNPLEQQDALIAMDLVIECARGIKSNWYPYLQVLPQTITRLDSFSKQEYDLLQDEDLTALGKASFKSLRQAFDEGIHPSLEATTSNQYKKPSQESCLSFEYFHLAVSIASSHAMILDNIKYMVPMADMINHADQPEEFQKKQSTFQLYHQRAGEMIQVFSDRQFVAGDMIVEEYGRLDNSLYIVAFGFVPTDNPHHCVLLPLPPKDMYASASNSLKRLRQDHSHACIGSEGRVLAGDEIGEKLLKILDASTSSTETTCSEDEETCKAVVDVRRIEFIRSEARQKLKQSKTSLKEDEQLLQSVLSTQSNEWRGMNRDRARVALQFVVEEKKLLTKLSELQ